MSCYFTRRERVRAAEEDPKVISLLHVLYSKNASINRSAAPAAQSVTLIADR